MSSQKTKELSKITKEITQRINDRIDKKDLIEILEQELEKLKNDTK